MVAARHTDDAFAALAVAQVSQPMRGEADFESADGLQAFGLAPDG
jgi:hypothetical protein